MQATALSLSVYCAHTFAWANCKANIGNMQATTLSLSVYLAPTFKWSKLKAKLENRQITTLILSVYGHGAPTAPTFNWSNRGNQASVYCTFYRALSRCLSNF